MARLSEHAHRAPLGWPPFVFDRTPDWCVSPSHAAASGAPTRESVATLVTSDDVPWTRVTEEVT